MRCCSLSWRTSLTWSLPLSLSVCLSPRLNLPRNLSQVGAEGEGEEEGVANMKAGLSSDRPEEASDGAGDMSFGYEFAQTEVLMNTMGQDGERERETF